MACLPCERCSTRILKLLCINHASKHYRSITTTPSFFLNKNSDKHNQKDIVESKPTPKEIFIREFPEYFNNGKFVSRIGYVQFIDEALARMKELGLERDREAYKELFKIFPPGIYHPPDKRMPSKWQYFPQQLAATRVLHQMAMNQVRIDKDFERLAVSIFSVHSEVWNKIARTNFWNMKLRNVDKYPLPEELPKEAHKLARIGLERMLNDELSVITTTNTSNLPDAVDKTWIVFSQSPTQKAIIDRLDEKSMLYIEEGGLTWVGRDSLSYFVLKFYVNPEVAKQKATPPKPDFNYNTLMMKFYGKPICEKLAEQEEKHYADGAYILSIGITGTSSQDSLSSWLKLLQKRNPKLNKLNVVFRTQRRAPEIVEYGLDQDSENHRTHQQTNS